MADSSTSKITADPWRIRSLPQGIEPCFHAEPHDAAVSLTPWETDTRETPDITWEHRKLQRMPPTAFLGRKRRHGRDARR